MALLCSLPYELLVSINSWLDASSLLALSITARSVHTPAQEVLHRLPQLKKNARRHDGPLSESTALRIGQLTRTLLQRPDLALKVRELCIYMGCDYIPPEKMIAFDSAMGMGKTMILAMGGNSIEWIRFLECGYAPSWCLLLLTLTSKLARLVFSNNREDAKLSAPDHAIDIVGANIDKIRGLQSLHTLKTSHDTLYLSWCTLPRPKLMDVTGTTDLIGMPEISLAAPKAWVVRSTTAIFLPRDLATDRHNSLRLLLKTFSHLEVLRLHVTNAPSWKRPSIYRNLISILRSSNESIASFEVLRETMKPLEEALQNLDIQIDFGRLRHLLVPAQALGSLEEGLDIWARNAAQLDCYRRS